MLKPPVPKFEGELRVSPRSQESLAFGAQPRELKPFDTPSTYGPTGLPGAIKLKDEGERIPSSKAQSLGIFQEEIGVTSGCADNLQRSCQSLSKKFLNPYWRAKAV